MHRISMLGTGLIGMFYTMALHRHRGRDRVHVAYSRSADRARAFAAEWGIEKHTTSLDEAIRDPDSDVVIVALPNHLHEQAVIAATKAGKAVLCTKPLGRNAAEALRMLEAVEKAGVYHGYLEDLCYTPKTLRALDAVQNGSIGKVLWVRSREAHPGPHSAWFWDKSQSGGGAIVDLGCHCVEIARNFIGKDIRPMEVVCWGDTQVHPIEAEDHAIGLVRYENGAIGQFEVSWAFRGGMDLRDEVAGTEGTIWLNHWLRTGMEMYTAVGRTGYVAEKAEGTTGWLFPVGDEPGALGYVDMFADMLNSLDCSTTPRETLYDGYVVNAIIDAAYASIEKRQWQPVKLPVWRGRESVESLAVAHDYDADHVLLKEERMMDGSTKLILRHKKTGQVVHKTR
ncbi:MAG TPA: Gfo/Idh/MocA family oxidoreductase [Lacipirellulaceae bacterium]|jgi:predicted dehydrogenase|nr:Gfo/Idh/MocA family oxidoreductase [Lacipirellulaceae bacterium]